MYWICVWVCSLFVWLFVSSFCLMPSVIVFVCTVYVCLLSKSWRLILILLISNEMHFFSTSHLTLPFNLLNQKLFIIHAQNLFSRFYFLFLFYCDYISFFEELYILYVKNGFKCTRRSHHCKIYLFLWLFIYGTIVRLCFFKCKSDKHIVWNERPMFQIDFFLLEFLKGERTNQTIERKRKQFCFSSKWPNDILWSGWFFFHFFFFAFSRQLERDGRKTKQIFFFFYTHSLWSYAFVCSFAHDAWFLHVCIV